MRYFSEIKQYVGFTQDDIDRLRELGPIMAPEFEATVKEFYNALRSNVHTRSVFEGPEQVERLCRTLIVWLGQLFEGPFDDTYYNARKRIGQVHVAAGLMPQFMFGAMDIIRNKLVSVACAADLDNTPLYLGSINKIVDLELTIMVQSYWDTMMTNKLQVPAALAAGMAHEIRNPLNAIGLQLTLLERRQRKAGTIDSGTEEVITTIRRELRRLAGLTSEIIDFSKPVEIEPTWVDFAELLERIRAVHGPSIGMMSMLLHTEIVGRPMVFCDHGRIHQSLVNLIANAIEALEGVEDGRIDVKVDNSATNTTTIIVSDNGSGMPAGVVGRVFELFFTTKGTGTGMGLPVVRKIMASHDGSINIRSKIGEGTTFTIVLPKPEEIS